MDNKNTSSGEHPHLGERQTASLLVRCWLEPQEGADETPIVRGYVRNLKTSEETFIGGVEAVGQQILRYLVGERVVVAEAGTDTAAATQRAR